MFPADLLRILTEANVVNYFIKVGCNYPMFNSVSVCFCLADIYNNTRPLFVKLSCLLLRVWNGAEVERLVCVSPMFEL